MKFLILCSSLDLRQPLSSTPSWWQLMKGLYEVGVEVVATTYQGPAVESLWWQAAPNPVRWQGDLFKALRDTVRRVRGPARPVQVDADAAESLSDRLVRYAAQTLIAPRWRNYLDRLLTDQPDIAAVLILTAPLNHLRGVARYLTEKHRKPVLYYDGDLPASLPQFRGFASGFRIYQGADLTEYAAMLGNSIKGVLYLRQMGARSVHVFHYAADPAVWSRVDVPAQDIDAFFYGHGQEYREQWVQALIAAPSLRLPQARFAVRGTHLGDLGRAEALPYLSFSGLREYACRAKLNLVITRQAHASVYGSSTARPFELAALGACMVSNPYEGVQEWFEPDREIVVVNSPAEAVERIGWLLDHEAERQAIGAAARERLLKEHTYRHRAEQLVGIVGEYL